MFLLDTCTLLWLASDQGQLSSPAKEAISAGAGRLFVSAISAFEIGVKHNKGKLKLPSPPDIWFPKALKLHGLPSSRRNSANRAQSHLASTAS